METSVMVEVPQDLVREVLQKLPMKSFCRFKIVCKQWHELISDSSMKSFHLRTTFLSSDVTTSIGKTPSLINHSLRATLVFQNDWLSNSTFLPDEVKRTINRRNRVIVGPFSGVYLVRDSSGNAALWNHVTGEYKIVSEANIWDGNQLITFGFGSEDMADGRTDFVVLKMHVNLKKPPKLYRLSSGSWKDLNHIPKEWNCRRISLPTATIDGVFYFVGQGSEGYFLISFDTKTETFDMLDVPEIDSRGPLALTCYTEKGENMLSLTLWTKTEGRSWIMRHRDLWVEKLITAGTVASDSQWLEVYIYTESSCRFFNHHIIRYEKTYKDVLMSSI